MLTAVPLRRFHTGREEVPLALTREAQIKPGYTHLYPELRPGWEPAETIAQRVADRVLATHGYAALLKGRVLSDTHFEFRGGSATLRPGGRISRLVDGRR
jgi:hypothetical protein